MKYAMIPCRYGSTRAKLKNLALIGGEPMMAWAIKAALESNCFDKVIVNGDNDGFRKIAEEYGVEYYERPTELGSSETLIDDVFYDFIEKHPYLHTVAIVNTINPLQTGEEIAKVMAYYEENELDSCNTYELKYIHTCLGDRPINFEYGKMCKTQDLEPVKLIAYSVQVVRTNVFMKEKNIFCGKHKMYGPISKKAGMVVKTPEDIELINGILHYNNFMGKKIEKFDSKMQIKKSTKKHIEYLFRDRSKGVDKVGVPLDKNERVTPFHISTMNDLRKKLANNVWKYPDVDAYYNIFADWLNIDSSKLFFTEGVSGAIRNLMELYAETTVYYDTPTYAMYDVYANIFRLIRDHNMDNADLIFLQNPNVPYGNSYSEDEIRNICSNTDKIIALDDVYFGFNVPDYLPLIDEYNNLVIMRSFSKAFGLASIRLGYIMSQEHNIKYISNNRNGYETNLLSLQTAHYFINHEEIKDEYVQEMNKGRDYLIEELNKMNVSTQGGEYGNFIFIHTDPNNAD